MCVCVCTHTLKVFEFVHGSMREREEWIAAILQHAHVSMEFNAFDSVPMRDLLKVILCVYMYMCVYLCVSVYACVCMCACVYTHA